jgi:hypothetical protein
MHLRPADLQTGNQMEDTQRFFVRSQAHAPETLFLSAGTKILDSRVTASSNPLI